LINLKNIHQNYIQGDSEIKVFKGLNFTTKKKENIGIIGPSGSGKSTLLNIIGLLEKPSSGEIEISGLNCHLMKNEERVVFRKKNIGFIFQNNQLLEDFSVEENVAMPLILNGFSYKKAVKKANESLENLGIHDRRKFKPGLLSGGEQQRVAIARALIKDPMILLADEPTGSLDNNNTSIVLDFITKLSGENKLLTIFATHNLNLIKKLDRCYKIEEGDLIAL
jgi:ABC-type lipoprotein export system ATPase subunit